MREYGLIAVLGVVLSGAGLGCSTTSRSPFVSAEDARINIEVTNFAFEDATLHVSWSGRRRRLGIVIGTQTAEFILPWDAIEEIRIEIDLLAYGRCTTRAVLASPGDVILLEIHPALRTCGL